jgi:hypothetical protein
MNIKLYCKKIALFNDKSTYKAQFHLHDRHLTHNLTKEYHIKSWYGMKEELDRALASLLPQV